MAKRITSPELTEEFAKTLAMTKMLEVEVDEELKKSFIAYAMAVNVSRAIPDIRDGLKPVHRRILYSIGVSLTDSPSTVTSFKSSFMLSPPLS